MNEIKLYHLTVDEFYKSLIMESLKTAAFNAKKEKNETAYNNYMECYYELKEQVLNH